MAETEVIPNMPRDSDGNSLLLHWVGNASEMRARWEGTGRQWQLRVMRGGPRSRVWYAMIDDAYVTTSARSLNDAIHQCEKRFAELAAYRIRVLRNPSAAWGVLRWAALRATAAGDPGEVLVKGPGAAADIILLLDSAFAQGARADRLQEENAELRTATLALARVVRGAMESGWLPAAPHQPAALALAQAQHAGVLTPTTNS